MKSKTTDVVSTKMVILVILRCLLAPRTYSSPRTIARQSGIGLTTETAEPTAVQSCFEFANVACTHARFFGIHYYFLASHHHHQSSHKTSLIKRKQQLNSSQLFNRLAQN